MRVFGRRERADLANERRANPDDMDVFRLQLGNWLRQLLDAGTTGPTASHNRVVPAVWESLEDSTDGFLPPPRKRAMTSWAGAEHDCRNQFHTFLRKQWGEPFPEGREAKPDADGDSEMEIGRTEPTAAGESPALLGAIRARIGVERDQQEVDLIPRPGIERDVDNFLRGLSRVSEAGTGGSDSTADGVGSDGGKTRTRTPRKSFSARRKRKLKRAAEEKHADGDT